MTKKNNIEWIMDVCMYVCINKKKEPLHNSWIIWEITKRKKMKEKKKIYPFYDLIKHFFEKKKN